MTKNWDETCDEEKSFNTWFYQNSEIDDKIITLLKEVYMQGYAAGFEAKRKHSAAEQLQK